MIRHRQHTILGDIPDGWSAKPLRTLLSDVRAGDWGDDTGEVTLSVLRSTNFTDSGNLDLADVARRGFRKAKAEQIQVSQNEILLERSGGGPNQPIGRVVIVREEMPETGFANFIEALRPNAEIILPELLFWTLHQLNRSGIVTRFQHQTTQMRNLDRRDYLKGFLPIPPTREDQDRISKTLRAADDYVRSVEGQIRQAQRVKKALLQVFPCVVKHGRGKPLFQIADISAGFTKGRDLSGNQTTSVAYLTVVNVLDGALDLSEVSQAQIKETELEDLSLKSGDILMTEGGDRDKLGRGCLWQGQIDPIVCQNHIFRVRPDQSQVRPWFLHYLLQSPYSKRYFFSAAKQTSNLCTINSRDLRRFLVPDLKPEEQDPWVDRVRAADSLMDSLRQQLTAARRLKQSLLQNLLTGKLCLKV